MENTMSVATALDSMFYEKNGKHMDEMRMHKLMYFVQRESLMYNNEPLFDAIFYGWKYGPVLSSVYEYFKSFGSKPITTYYMDTDNTFTTLDLSRNSNCLLYTSPSPRD